MTNATNNTNANAKASRVSYVLTGKRENQATAKATAAAKAATANATKATAKAKDATKAANNAYDAIMADFATANAKAETTIANALVSAVAFAATAKDVATAKHAARTAAKAAKATDTATATAANELALNALTVSGAYAYMDATAAEWVSMRNDVETAEFVRHATAKAASMRLVVTKKDGHKVYLTVNTTASLDWRKIDAAYNRRLANQAKKAAAKAAKKAKK